MVKKPQYKPMRAQSQTLSDLGELAIIDRLKAFCPEGVIGDDAAVVEVRAGYRLVVTTDMLLQGVHFSDRTTPPHAIGWRATAANLSDLAAMGATPTGITIALGLPASTSLSWIEALYQGISECLGAYGGVILGGDLSRAKQQTISITALGEVQPERAICRNTARPEMTVVVSGPHGGSRAGLALLLEELALAAHHRTYATAWIRAHQRPIPRFDVIAKLREIAGDRTPYPVIAGMDSSDGLANALLQLSKSSGVGMDVVRSQIPLPVGLSAVVGPKTALDWALYGGEDFELVLCLPPDVADQLIQTGLATAIGSTTHTGEVRLFNTEGSDQSERLSHQSFQHF